MKHGFDDGEWNRAREEATQILARRASERGMITYGELCRGLSAIRIDPHDPALWELLGEISHDEAEAGRGMLSVIVVHKYGEMEPGAGFFELAGSLGRDVSDRTTCWVTELHRVHGYWSEHQAAM